MSTEDFNTPEPVNVPDLPVDERPAGLQRGAILAAAAAPEPELLRVPEWDSNGTKAYVYVRELTVAERDEYENALVDRKGRFDNKNARARLLVLGTVDEKGRNVFRKGSADFEIISQLGASGVDRVSRKIAEVSGMNMDDIDEAAENFS